MNPTQCFHLLLLLQIQGQQKLKRPHEFHLFVGGGITDKSIAEDEYLETEIKSQTLLSVIKKM